MDEVVLGVLLHLLVSVGYFWTPEISAHLLCQVFWPILIWRKTAKTWLIFEINAIFFDISVQNCTIKRGGRLFRVLLYLLARTDVAVPHFVARQNFGLPQNEQIPPRARDADVHSSSVFDEPDGCLVGVGSDHRKNYHLLLGALKAVDGLDVDRTGLGVVEVEELAEFAKFFGVR